MTKNHEDIERLITRSLDGELSDEEQLALNRELIRNPQARQWLDDFRRIDTDAAEAMHDALATDQLPLDPETLPARDVVVTTRRLHQGWWMWPGVVAAAISAYFMARAPAPSLQHQQPVINQMAKIDQPSTRPPFRAPLESSRQVPMRNVGTVLPQIKRDAAREVIGVVGDDGNIYWIEVDRTYTYKRPGRSGATRRPRERI